MSAAAIPKKKKKQTRRQWFLVRCKSGQERSAEERLKQQGFAPYLPLMVEVRGRKQQSEVRPLFATYLFIYCDPARKSMRPVSMTRGVIGLVRFGDRLAVLPDELIAELRKHEDAQGVPRVQADWYRKGDLVRVTDGVFAGDGWRVEEDQRNGRVIVSLGFVQRLAMPAQMVERWSDGSSQANQRDHAASD